MRVQPTNALGGRQVANCAWPFEADNYPLCITVDLDMWWHCRWATGAPKSRWPSVEALLKEIYPNKPRPTLLADYSYQVLELLAALQVKATFFVLGQVAEWHPNLIKEIVASGHELACHGWFHIDATLYDRQRYKQELTAAKKLLEDISGTEVIGYRAPNLVVSEWLFDIVQECGFFYDSSLCPAHKFLGKFGGASRRIPNCPHWLINPSGQYPDLFEFPIPVMPGIGLPVGSGIFTRVLGETWSKIGLRQALKYGPTMYYFHPYEIGDPPEMDIPNLYVQVFLWRLGQPYKAMLPGLFKLAPHSQTITAGEAFRMALKPDISRD